MTWVTPPLSDCLGSGIEPTRYSVLVAMATKPAKTAGGIILTDATNEKDQWAAKLARLVAVSPLAFSYADWPEGSRKPQVGDVVFVGLYPGEDIELPDGRKFRICQDSEIEAVVERTAEDVNLEQAA
jgi:co-chaperonin GroES (HSP10)